MLLYSFAFILSKLKPELLTNYLPRVTTLHFKNLA